MLSMNGWIGLRTFAFPERRPFISVILITMMSISNDCNGPHLAFTCTIIIAICDGISRSAIEFCYAVIKLIIDLQPKTPFTATKCLHSFSQHDKFDKFHRIGYLNNVEIVNNWERGNGFSNKFIFCSVHPPYSQNPFNFRGIAKQTQSYKRVCSFTTNEIGTRQTKKPLQRFFVDLLCRRYINLLQSQSSNRIESFSDKITTIQMQLSRIILRVLSVDIHRFEWFCLNTVIRDSKLVNQGKMHGAKRQKYCLRIKYWPWFYIYVWYNIYMSNYFLTPTVICNFG